SWRPCPAPPPLPTLPPLSLPPLPPPPPLVLGARIGGLDGIGVGAHLENDVDDVLERDVVLVRPVIAAPAGVKAHPLRRNIPERVIERVEAQLGIFAVLRHAHPGVDLPAV